MHWEYTKRPDGKIAITLDNNVWDFLFLKEPDLASELPLDHFAIFITREVEIETSAIPAHPSKAALKDYIARTIVNCDIRTTSVFGFATAGPGPQRVGGFGQGRGSLRPNVNSMRRSKTDTSLGKAKRTASLRTTRPMPLSRQNPFSR
jgi:hypothetical protein